MDREWAHRVLHELNRKLFLLRAEQDATKRMRIVDSILAEKKDAPIEKQGEERQLKLLLGLEE